VAAEASVTPGRPFTSFRHVRRFTLYAPYWLRVSGVAGVGEHARSGEDLGLSRRCDGFVILCVGSENFIIPGSCEITTRSAPSPDSWLTLAEVA
jgi:hypothetical protein